MISELLKSKIFLGANWHAISTLARMLQSYLNKKINNFANDCMVWGVTGVGI